ncbi:IPT/TIG domain-containing protein [Candidatus Poribacteria bacterium]|nr:IPT/TIG domain-containing protein [Candidatus Poribacteria bacterium]
MKHTLNLWLGLAILWLVIPINSHAGPILSVHGVVMGTDGRPANGLEVTVTNEAKNLTLMGITGESGAGAYSVVFFELSGVADAGDQIKVTVKQEGQVVAETTYTLTQEDIAAFIATINIQLKEKAAAPTLTKIEPNNGVVTGGTTVQFIGTNFQNGATITIGGNAVTEVKFISSTALTAKTPKGVAGIADVVVINPDGQSVTRTGGFTYILLPPAITKLNPTNGPVTGGTLITITGDNFQKGVTVRVGAKDAVDVTFVSAAELTAKTPAGDAGATDVVVTNPDGQSITFKGGFTYIQFPPSVTKLNPTSGLVMGGTLITITGDNFQKGVTVRVGEKDATNITFVSATELTATVPPGKAGEVDVTVINPDGQKSTLSAIFTYRLPAPTLTSIAPDTDTTAGGAPVRLIGVNFQAGASVKFGGNEAINVLVVSETEITVKVPQGQAGVVDVTVTNPDGQSAVIKFTYKRPQFPAYDVNQDGIVNIFDLVLVGGQFGQSGAGLSGDANGDGIVNIFDLVLAGGHFGETTVAVAPPFRSSKGMDFRANMGSPSNGTSLRLRAALTELENLSDTTPMMRFISHLLRQWLVDNSEIPTETKLLPNYPNPFNPETWLPYQLAKAAEVRISIYNIMGERVRQIEVGHQDAGMYLRRTEAAYWDQWRLFLRTPGGHFYCDAKDDYFEIGVRYWVLGFGACPRSPKKPRSSIWVHFQSRNGDQ